MSTPRHRRRADAIHEALELIDRELDAVTAHPEALELRARVAELRAAVHVHAEGRASHDEHNRMQTRLLALHLSVRKLARAAR